jgi:hypothetical protein
MTTPRRRIVRPSPPPANGRVQANQQIQKLRSRLEAERTALSRWMPRLKRSFNTVLKLHQRLVRLERQIARLEE